jgi:molybdopterin-guanine dinucleotide biosynthesis protein A
MFHNISAAILAGGSGKRFNDLIKAKIVVDGKTIISRIIEAIGDVFDEIIIVTNSPDEFTDYKSYKIIVDQYINKGPLGGIHSALKHTDREALFVVAGDMPFLEKELIISQVDHFFNITCDILIPKIDQYIEPLHGIYRTTILSTLEEYMAGENDLAVQEFIKNMNTCFLHINGAQKHTRAFTNINSPFDILKVNIMAGDK